MSSNYATYVPNVAEHGNVSLTVTYSNDSPSEDSPSEDLIFTSIEDMEACSVARPFIPMSVWDDLFEMYKASQARFKPKFF